MAPIDVTPPRPGTDRPGSRVVLSPASTVLLAIVPGLCGGYLDLVVMTVMKYWWNDLKVGVHGPLSPLRPEIDTPAA